MKGENAMSEALLLVAEGYEQIAAGIRKMVAAQKDTPKKEEKPVKKAEKKEWNKECSKVYNKVCSKVCSKNGKPTSLAC